MSTAGLRAFAAPPNVEYLLQYGQQQGLTMPSRHALPTILTSYGRRALRLVTENMTPITADKVLSGLNRAYLQSLQLTQTYTPASDGLMYDNFKRTNFPFGIERPPPAAGHALRYLNNSSSPVVHTPKVQPLMDHNNDMAFCLELVQDGRTSGKIKEVFEWSRLSQTPEYGTN